MSSAFKVNISNNFADKTAQIAQEQSKNLLGSVQKSDSGQSFADLIGEGIESVNQSQVNADKMSTNLSTGKSENIHETMLAVSHAELSFKMMVQIRNKALEAYQEIMRMQV